MKQKRTNAMNYLDTQAALNFKDLYYNATYREVDKDKEFTSFLSCAQPGHILHIWKRQGIL